MNSPRIPIGQLFLLTCVKKLHVPPSEFISKGYLIGNPPGMRTSFSLIPLILATALSASSPNLEHDILPMFQKHCMGCHGGLKKKAGLDLRTLETMLKGSEDGEVLVPGKPNESPLWLSVQEEEMPKGKDKLSKAEKDTLHKWIKAGLPKYADTAKIAKSRLEPGKKHQPIEIAREIDRLVNAKLTLAKVPAVQKSDDAEFLRRVSLDISGTIPTPEATKAFLQSRIPEKRGKLVDQLLQSPQYGHHFGRLWRDWICPPELPSDMNSGRQPVKQARALGDWFAQKFNSGESWDKTVSSLLNFTGQEKGNPQHIFFPLIGQNAKATPENSANAIGSLFMGRQFQCAQCHDDPYRDFAQEDFWALSAFFNSMQADFKKVEKKEMEPVIQIPRTAFLNSGTNIQAAFPGKEPIQEKKKTDWRPVFTKWLVAKDNPFFAEAFANRLWFQLFGTGIVNPIDDIRPLNPPTHPAVLGLLANEFRDSGYDVRHLIRCITSSDTYQRTSEPPKGLDSQQLAIQQKFYGRAPVRVMTTDQLHESLKLAFGEKRIDIRSHQKDSGNTNGESAAVGDEYMEFQRKFATNEEDPADFTHGIPQMLTFLNHPRFLNGSLSLTEFLEKNPDTPPPGIINWLYFATLSRNPTQPELEDATAFLASAKDPTTARNDLLWVLVNQSEFILVK